MMRSRRGEGYKDGTVTPSDDVPTPQRSRRASSAKVKDVWEDLIAARHEIEERDAELARLRESLAAHKRSDARAAKATDKMQRELAEKSERVLRLEAEMSIKRTQERQLCNSLETAAVARLAESLQRDLAESRGQVERLQAELESKTRVVQLSERLQRDIKESWEQVDKLQSELVQARQKHTSSGACLPSPVGTSSEVVTASQVAELEAAARALDAVVRSREARLAELEELTSSQAERIAELEERRDGDGKGGGGAWAKMEARLAELQRLTNMQAARIAELEDTGDVKPASEAGNNGELEATWTADFTAGEVARIHAGGEPAPSQRSPPCTPPVGGCVQAGSPAPRTPAVSGRCASAEALMPAPSAASGASAAAKAAAAVESAAATVAAALGHAQTSHGSVSRAAAESMRAITAAVKGSTPEPLIGPRGSPSYRCHSPMTHRGESAAHGAPPPSSSRGCRSPVVLDRAHTSRAMLQQQTASTFSLGVSSEKSCACSLNVAGHAGASANTPALGGSALVQAAGLSMAVPAASTSASAMPAEGASVTVAAATPGTPLLLMKGSSAVASSAEPRVPLTGRHYIVTPRVEPQTRSPSPRRCGLGLRICASPSTRGSPRVQPVLGRLR
uniref:Uncharacterized protein n=1 Tax=Alexandrium monilatum TaxID=311494 RepID=A0A7S4VBC2_9DINO